MITKNRLKSLSTVFIFVLIFQWIGIPSSFSADTEKAKEHYNEGIKAKQDGDIESAISAYEAAIKADPDYIDSYINLGAIYFETKEYEKALTMFKKATEKDEKNVTAFANLGRVQYSLQRWVEAETAFKTAISLDGKNFELYRELGKVYYKKRDFPKVIETIVKCHELGGEDDNTYFMLGKGYQNQEKIKEAISAFKKSLELKDSYKAHSALGGIYLGQGKFLSAANEFKAALKANPKGHRAAYNYAIAIQSQNPESYDVNIKAWQDYIKLAKNNPKAKNQVAEAQRVIKDLKEAKEKANLQ